MGQAGKTNYVDQHVGRRFQLYRKAEGFSLDDVGHILEIDVNTLKTYESGEVRIPPEIMIQFCLLMKIRPRALFDGLEVMAAGLELGSHCAPQQSWMGSGS